MVLLWAFSFHFLPRFEPFQGLATNRPEKNSWAGQACLGRASARQVFSFLAAALLVEASGRRREQNGAVIGVLDYSDKQNANMQFPERKEMSRFSIGPNIHPNDENITVGLR